MGIEVIVAAASLVGTAASIDQQKKAERAQKRVRNEERARNQAQQAAERRQQIREERIKRARVLQASANTGTVGSSGEAGAVASLNTQLGANIGYNLSMAESANRIGTYSQQAADARASASIFSALTSSAGDMMTVGESIFKTEPVKKT